ncbi:putative 11-S seed storage protein, plant [Helianthus anomalus]
MSMGVISWWFNGGDTDVAIIFLGESTKALEPGHFTYFLVAGTLGTLVGFQSDFVARTFNLSENEASTLVHNQPETLITQIDKGVKLPKPNKQVTETIYAAIDTPTADVVVKEGGIVNSLTEYKIPVLGKIGLSARFVRLEGNAMLVPSYLADGSIILSYVTKGSGLIRIVGSTGKADLDTRVEEGDLFIVPPFFAVAGVADDCGMDLFSVHVFGQIAGEMSIWNALSPKVLQTTLNINPELAEDFKSRNAKSISIIP